MSRYAEKTAVSVARSKAEIERVLMRYGATGFTYGCEDDRAVIGFRANAKFVRFNLDLPVRGEFLFSKHDPPRKRDARQVESAHEQACRSAWRALNLVIKAKLEAVESGITTFEEEFLAHLLLPNGQTAGEQLIPQIEMAWQDGGVTMPKLLPFAG